MSRTLFRYIFKDLLRIFLLTTAALAGIMSFGGLLRPLTEHGLGALQVGKMLAYFLPAMMTYSLPIAALFATTMVYGRLSADNELTACRAGGISHLAIAIPALVLGLTVAIVSLLFLCFIVPVFTLKVEKVIYSNLALLAANQIERTHQIDLPGQVPVTIFAQQAYVPPPDPARNEQIVVLSGPMIVTYKPADGDSKVLIPKEFWMASQATAYIREDSSGPPTLEAVLEGGIGFPRQSAGAVELSIQDQQFGPYPLPSPLKENTKFMDIAQLQELYKNPANSQRVKEVVRRFNLIGQQNAYLGQIFETLNGPDEEHVFERSDGQREQFILTRNNAPIERRGEGIIIGSDASSDERPVQMIRRQGGDTTLAANARQVQVHVEPDPRAGRVFVTLEFLDALVHIDDVATPRKEFAQRFSVPMPPEVLKVGLRTATDYAGSGLPDIDTMHLTRTMIVMTNQVQSELHARASFSVSCLILVMVGCGLGMLFKSGNFLSAFAISVIPALLCIVLILTGQQTAENIPHVLDPGFANPLRLGLTLIWSGNLVVLAIAVGLLGKLQRQ